MAFQSVPEGAEAVVNSTYGGRPIVNVFNFRKPGGYNATDLQALADVVDGWYGTGIGTYLDAGFAYVNTLVRGLELVNDLTANADANAGNGAVAGFGTPNNVALCLTHRTGLTGRSARGRTYFAGAPSTVLQTVTTFATTFVNNMVTFMNLLAPLAGAEGWVFSVLSRYASGAARPTGILFPITLSEARNVNIDSQRGRLIPGH